MRPPVHGADPTREAGQVSPVTGTSFADTSLCRRVPTAHGMYIAATPKAVTCSRCLEIQNKAKKK